MILPSEFHFRQLSPASFADWLFPHIPDAIPAHRRRAVAANLPVARIQLIPAYPAEVHNAHHLISCFSAHSFVALNASTTRGISLYLSRKTFASSGCLHIPLIFSLKPVFSTLSLQIPFILTFNSASAMCVCLFRAATTAFRVFHAPINFSNFPNPSRIT